MKEGEDIMNSVEYYKEQISILEKRKLRLEKKINTIKYGRTEIEIIRDLIDGAEHLQSDFGKDCKSLIIEGNSLISLKQN